MEDNELKGLYDRYVSLHFRRAHSFSDREYERRHRFFAKNYRPHLPPQKDARILDVGCGAGFFVSFLASAGYSNYEGIDISEECIRICQKRGLRAKMVDCFNFLGQKHGYYDCIVANDFLEHFDKSRVFRLLALFRRALKPAGTLIVKVPNMAAPLVGCRNRYADITHCCGFTDNALVTVLESADFEQPVIFGPDIYNTRSTFANLGGRMFFSFFRVLFRLLYLVQGVSMKHVMTGTVVAVARKPQG